MEKQTNGIKTIAGAIIVAGLLIAGAIFVSNSGKDNSPTPSAQNSALLKINDLDHVKGNPKAPITLIEYSDFQCPYCKQFDPTVTELLLKYPNDIKFVYRHFPLISIHPEAKPSAIASECVAKLAGVEAFWDFSEFLFENQKTLGSELYQSFALKAGINQSDFDACINSEEIATRIKNDMADAQIMGIRSTPSSFLILPDGQSIPFSGALPLETLETLVDRALVK